MAQRPVFLEKRSYRQRRLMDAVRFLPLVGLALWMVPLMWSTGEGSTVEPKPKSAALIYVFGVWLLLVLADFALWLRTRPSRVDPQDTGNEGD